MPAGSKDIRQHRAALSARANETLRPRTSELPYRSFLRLTTSSSSYLHISVALELLEIILELWIRKLEHILVGFSYLCLGKFNFIWLSTNCSESSITNRSAPSGRTRNWKMRRYIKPPQLLKNKREEPKYLKNSNDGLQLIRRSDKARGALHLYHVEFATPSFFKLTPTASLAYINAKQQTVTLRYTHTILYTCLVVGVGSSG